VPELYRALLGVLTGRPDLAAAAARTLTALGPPPDELVSALSALVQGARAPASARVFATRALASRCADGTPVAATLLASLADPELEVRRAVSDVLSKAGLKAPAAVDALVRALGDTDALVRLRMTTALAALPQGSRPLAALLRAYDDPDHDVMRKAAEGLARDRPSQADALVLAKAAAGRGPRARLFALSLVAEQGPAAVGALTAALRDDHAAVRLLALDGLARIGPDAKAAAGAVAALLKDPDLGVGVRAATALLAMKRSRRPRPPCCSRPWPT
jgi:HEAT repeat protein